MVIYLAFYLANKIQNGSFVHKKKVKCEVLQEDQCLFDAHAFEAMTINLSVLLLSDHLCLKRKMIVKIIIMLKLYWLWYLARV